MAEFCLECFNSINDCKLTEREVTLTTEPCFCEECSEMKPIVVKLHPRRQAE